MLVVLLGILYASLVIFHLSSFLISGFEKGTA